MNENNTSTTGSVFGEKSIASTVENREPQTINEFFDRHPEVLAEILAWPDTLLPKITCPQCGEKLEHRCVGER